LRDDFVSTRFAARTAEASTEDTTVANRLKNAADGTRAPSSGTSFRAIPRVLRDPREHRDEAAAPVPGGSPAAAAAPGFQHKPSASLTESITSAATLAYSAGTREGRRPRGRFALASFLFDCPPLFELCVDISRLGAAENVDPEEVKRLAARAAAVHKQFELAWESLERGLKELA
jgi:hypothetical protein